MPMWIIMYDTYIYVYKLKHGRPNPDNSDTGVRFDITTHFM
jgi:hypothetical protein